MPQYGIEKNQEILFIRWQGIRRSTDFRKFCDAHKSLFNEDLFIDECCYIGLNLKKNIESLRNRYGLNLIYHYIKDFSEDEIINSLAFEAPFATKLEYQRENYSGGTDDEDISIEQTPIWNDHFIKLTINISEEYPMALLLDEIREKIKVSKEVLALKSKRQSLKAEDFLVYDAIESTGDREAVIKQFWPEEYLVAFGEKTSRRIKEKDAGWDKASKDEEYVKNLRKTLRTRLDEIRERIDSFINLL